MIIAVDFDGILCENKFPGIGPETVEMVKFIRLLIQCGHEVILWTSRVDQPLEDAVNWCNERGLRFCAVNDNAPSNKAKYSKLYPNGTRKVYADVYIDDHNPEFWGMSQGMGRMFAIQMTINRVKEIIKWRSNM